MPFAIDKLKLNSLDAEGDKARLHGLYHALDCAFKAGLLMGNEIEEAKLAKEFSELPSPLALDSKVVTNQDAQEFICRQIHSAMDDLEVTLLRCIKWQRAQNVVMKRFVDDKS